MGSSATPSDHYFSPEPHAPVRPRTITVELSGAKGEVVVSNGVFSPSRVDPGTAVLLRTVTLPAMSDVDLLDLGCGWGPIALSLAIAAPQARVWAVDVNERALDLTRINAERLGLGNVTTALPDDVPSDLKFAEIWSNPPIRVGKTQLHQILEKWLARLAFDGTAWLVVQKNLGADSLAKWLHALAEFDATKVASSKGYRVLKVTPTSKDSPAN